MIRTTKCKDCGCDIVAKSVRGPMPERCRACARKRATEQKRKHDASRKKAGVQIHHRKGLSSKSLSAMSPVRRRIEERRRMNREYYSYCAMP